MELQTQTPTRAEALLHEYAPRIDTVPINVVKRVLALANDLREQGLTRHNKGVTASGYRDFATNADIECQRVCQDAFAREFPGFGFVGEEGPNGQPLVLPCTLPGVNARFIVDPIDGTTAYAMGWHHGVACMIALEVDGRVVASWIGDLGTRRITYFTPTLSPRTFDPVNGIRELTHPTDDRDMRDCVVSCGSPPRRYSPMTRDVLLPSGTQKSVFSLIDVSLGSIGWRAMNVLHDEQQALLLRHGGTWTEWDEFPMNALFEQMGFVFLYCTDRGTLDNSPVARRFPDGQRTHDVLIIHESRLEKFLVFYLHARKEFRQSEEPRQI